MEGAPLDSAISRLVIELLEAPMAFTSPMWNALDPLPAIHSPSAPFFAWMSGLLSFTPEKNIAASPGLMAAKSVRRRRITSGQVPLSAQKLRGEIPVANLGFGSPMCGTYSPQYAATNPPQSTPMLSRQYFSTFVLSIRPIEEASCIVS